MIFVMAAVGTRKLQEAPSLLKQTTVTLTITAEGCSVYSGKLPSRYHRLVHVQRESYRPSSSGRISRVSLSVSMYV